MTPTKIQGHTHTFIGGDGIEDIVVKKIDEGKFMVSEWRLSDEERSAIANGATVFLHVQGEHPPVALSVGKHLEFD